MARTRLLKVISLIIIILLLPFVSYSINKPSPDKSAIMAKTAKLAIPFIENQGQIKDKAVKFYANTFAGNVYVTEKGEVVYGLVKAEGSRQKAVVAAEHSSAKIVALKETLIGAKETNVK